MIRNSKNCKKKHFFITVRTFFIINYKLYFFFKVVLNSFCFHYQPACFKDGQETEGITCYPNKPPSSAQRRKFEIIAGNIYVN